MTKLAIPNAAIQPLTWHEYTRTVVFDGLRWIRPKANLADVKIDSIGGADASDALALLTRMEATCVDQVWVYPTFDTDNADDLLPEPTPDAIALCEAADWNVSVARVSYSSPDGGAWISATHPGVFGIREIYWPARDRNALWHDGHPQGPVGLALTLARYEAALGSHFFRSPGATGQRVMREAMTHHTYPLTPDTTPPPAMTPGRHLDGALIWLRDVRGVEATRRWLVSLDRHAAWLSAAGMTTLGIGAPSHVEGDAAAKMPRIAKAGMFHLVDYAPPLGALALGMPDPLESNMLRRRHSGWVSLPTLQLLDELGAGYRVDEAYVHAVGHRVLEGWYQRLKTARDKLLPVDSDALGMLKRTYTAGMGWLAADERDGWDRSQDCFYRPDWYAAIKSLGRANLYRAGYAAALHGFEPLAASTDAWYYLVDDAGLAQLGRITNLRGKRIYPVGDAMTDWAMSAYDLERLPAIRALLNNDGETRWPTGARLQLLLKALNRQDRGGTDEDEDEAGEVATNG